jgi:hypothetical protein
MPIRRYKESAFQKIVRFDIADDSVQEPITDEVIQPRIDANIKAKQNVHIASRWSDGQTKPCNTP